MLVGTSACSTGSWHKPVDDEAYITRESDRTLLRTLCLKAEESGRVCCSKEDEFELAWEKQVLVHMDDAMRVPQNQGRLQHRCPPFL